MKRKMYEISLKALAYLTHLLQRLIISDLHYVFLQSVLSGSVVVENARANADYTVTFAGVGEAPAQTVSGQVVERVDKLFADIQINLDNLVPQNIASYTARSGHDLLESASNLDGNNMKDVHSAGFRKALREILEKTMASNVKVQINKSIQDMKNA